MQDRIKLFDISGALLKFRLNIPILISLKRATNMLSFFEILYFIIKIVHRIKVLPMSYGFPLFSFVTFEINLSTSHAPQSSGQVIVFSGVAHFYRF